jgi:single-strand DNA-binding protein
MNSLTVSGNLTKDPELRKTSDGKSVVSFSIADGKEKTIFWDCSAWSKTADNIHTYFKKGDQIIATGRVELNEYTDRDGVAKKGLRFTVSDFTFGQKGKGHEEPEKPKITPSKWGAQPQTIDGEEIALDDNPDLPF